MAARRPKTLQELNILLAAYSLMTDEERASGKKLPVMRQARLMVKAMPKATRVAKFVALWAIMRYQQGSASVERLAEEWDEPERTMYRHLEEFREVWALAGYESPDELADLLIADYRKRRERLAASDVARLLGAPVAVALPDLPALAAPNP
jgi:hypothetical protein